MRVLLAESQPKVRGALWLLLQEQPAVEVVGGVADARALLLAVKQRCPDLLLLEWGLPPEAPDMLMRLIRLRCPDLQVVVLGSYPEMEGDALAAGAAAFVGKGETPGRLMSVLRAVAQDQEASPISAGPKTWRHKRHKNQSTGG